MIYTENEYGQAIKNAEHYIAIEQTNVHLLNTDDLSLLPWDYVTSVNAGATMRLGIPTNIYLEAKHPCGLTFSWSVNLEKNDANGTGTNKLDGKIFCDLASKLPKNAVEKFVSFLEDKILPDVQKRTSEIKSSLYIQLTSEIILEETIKQLKALTK